MLWGGAAGGDRNPEARAASARAAWRRANAMSNNYDVVVVGGGISGQSRLRALLSLLALGEVVAYGGAQGCHGQGLPPGASRLSMHPGNQRCQNPPPWRKVLVCDWTEAGTWKSVESLGPGLTSSLKGCQIYACWNFQREGKGGGQARDSGVPQRSVLCPKQRSVICSNLTWILSTLA